MFQKENCKLPFMKRSCFQQKQALNIVKIEKIKQKQKQIYTQKYKKKMSLDQKEINRFQKRCLSQKKFSLKKVATEKIFEKFKLSERNTDDTSEKQKNSETFQQNVQKKINKENIVRKGVNMLKNMKQVQKIGYLYKKEGESKKSSEMKVKNESNLKNKYKYKCLVNADVFNRKKKHNKSDGLGDKSKQRECDYWQKIDESLILESTRCQELSKELFELVENLN